MALPEQTIRTLVAAYESLRPQSIGALLACYAENARFRDPFNDVVGRPAIGAVFAHMFETVEAPAFRVDGRFDSTDAVVLRWEFSFRSARLGGAQAITGLSTLRFDGDGRVVEHIDYWDAAGSLYEKLPLIGWVLRRLRRTLAAPQR